MKVLILIISSDDIPVYEKHHTVWRTYMNSAPMIDSYFIKYHEELTGLHGDTFYLSGTESYENIITKTLDAFEYFKHSSYDFIIRSNLSSLWNFTALLTYLQTLPSQGVYSGIIGNYNGLQYVSGAGIIITPDILRILLDYRAHTELIRVIDDVDIGCTLLSMEVQCSQGNRKDFFSREMVDAYTYDPSVYHYRFKWHNSSLREEEPDCMLALLERF